MMNNNILIVGIGPAGADCLRPAAEPEPEP
jgi:hypothetical protein